jgi:hypothetical protein
MSNLVHDLHIERPAERDFAAAKALNRIVSRGAYEVALLCRGSRDIDRSPRATLRLRSLGKLRGL